MKAQGKSSKGLAIPWLGAESDVVVIGVADGRSEGTSHEQEETKVTRRPRKDEEDLRLLIFVVCSFFNFN